MRKSRISDKEKKQWPAVKIWAATGGYSAFKPQLYTENALVILEHNSETGPHPMKKWAAVTQQILFPKHTSDSGTRVSTVILVDITTLVPPAEMKEAFAMEASSREFQKAIGKPLSRKLARLHLKGATLVAYGQGCQLLIKLLGSKVGRALTVAQVSRGILIHPDLPDFFISTHLTGPNSCAPVRMDIVFIDAMQRQTQPVIRRTFTKGSQCDFQSVTTSVLASLTSDNSASSSAVWADATAAPIFDPGYYDCLGQCMFVAEVTIEMNAATKQDVILSFDVTQDVLHEADYNVHTKPRKAPPADDMAP